MPSVSLQKAFSGKREGKKRGRENPRWKRTGRRGSESERIKHVCR